MKTADFSLPPLPPALLRLREEAKQGLDPTAADETLALLLSVARMRAPARILEIGTAEGLTACALLLECPRAELVTIENDAERHARARQNFAAFGVGERVRSLLGDAAEILPALQGAFDLIFLDGPKAQYIHYYPILKELLAPRGVLFADDVLLYGWVDGRVPPPPRRRSIAARLREYLDAVQSDADLITCIFEAGEGAAVSVKNGAACFCGAQNTGTYPGK